MSLSLAIEKNGKMVMPELIGNAGGREQGEGKSHGKKTKNLFLKMLNLRCLEDKHVEINVQQTGANSELVLE